MSANVQGTSASEDMGGAATVSKYAVSFGLSYVVTSLLSAILVVIKETNEDSVLAWMKAATGHHWVTQGILDLLVFVVLGAVFAKLAYGARMSANALSTWIVGATVVSGLIIFGFYVV